jgi:predicted transcriptional regulator
MQTDSPDIVFALEGVMAKSPSLHKVVIANAIAAILERDRAIYALRRELEAANAGRVATPQMVHLSEVIR